MPPPLKNARDAKRAKTCYPVMEAMPGIPQLSELEAVLLRSGWSIKIAADGRRIYVCSFIEDEIVAYTDIARALNTHAHWASVARR